MQEVFVVIDEQGGVDKVFSEYALASAYVEDAWEDESLVYEIEVKELVSF